MSGSIVRRLHARALHQKVSKAEARILPTFSGVVCFSSKDEELVRRRGAKNTKVIVPPFSVNGSDSFEKTATEGSSRTSRRSDETVLFTGVLDRAVNDEAACWLLEEIWPRIIASRPRAELVIAGSGPSKRLRRLAARYVESVQVTGHVPSLTPYYKKAKVFVAPLRSGAGLKFKCVDAILAGCEVVATHVGAEGIDDDLFFSIADTSAALAIEVVQALDAPKSPITISRRINSVVDTFSAARHARRIQAYYSSVITKSRTGATTT